MAAVCLLVGLAVGYFFRGSQPAAAPGHQIEAGNSTSPTAGDMPTLEQMKHMADKKVGPLLARLQTNPSDAALLIQIGDTYKQTHQFPEAADYYQRSLRIDPKNAGVR